MDNGQSVAGKRSKLRNSMGWSEDELEWMNSTLNQVWKNK